MIKTWSKSTSMLLLITYAHLIINSRHCCVHRLLFLGSTSVVMTYSIENRIKIAVTNGFQVHTYICSPHDMHTSSVTFAASTVSADLIDVLTDVSNLSLAFSCLFSQHICVAECQGRRKTRTTKNKYQSNVRTHDHSRRICAPHHRLPLLS